MCKSQVKVYYRVNDIQIILYKNMIAFDWIIIENVFSKTWYVHNMHIWENFTLILNLWECYLNWIQHFDCH